MNAVRLRTASASSCPHLQPAFDRVLYSGSIERRHGGLTAVLEDLDQAVLKDALNTDFEIRPDPGTAVPAKLVELTDLGSTAEVQQFSAVFHSPSPVILQQQIYTIE